MCLVCECKYVCKRLEDIKELECKNCPDVTEIPPIPSLRKLTCIGCPRLSVLPPRLEALDHLQVVQCPISSVPDYPRLTTLHVCESGPAISIRSLSLRSLHYNGGILSEFPAVPNVDSVSLFYTSIAVIPPLQKLRHLRISTPEVAPTLPIFPSILALKFDHCKFLISVPRMPVLQGLFLLRGESPFAYVARDMRGLAGGGPGRSFTVGSKVRAWSWRSKQRIASRLELRRVLAALHCGGTAAFVGPVIDIVACLL